LTLDKTFEERDGRIYNLGEMRLDDIAALYGLFQLVFADVTDHLAVATFRLRERKDPGLTFETVFRQQFKQILKQFQRELDQFDGDSPVADSVDAVRAACETMSTLADWRNDRIHARIRMTEHGYALYDWRTRRRLEITREDIERNIDMAANAIAELEGHVKHLVGVLTWDEEFEKLLGTLPDDAEAN
jgi:hypothetical protein